MDNLVNETNDKLTDIIANLTKIKDDDYLIILDLKGKLADHQDLFAVKDLDELVSVLESLGYKKNDIKAILPKVDATKELESQIKEALKLLMSR